MTFCRWLRLWRLVKGMSPLEYEAFMLIAQRVHDGRPKYGPLQRTDPRNFMAQGTEELADGCFYFTVESLLRSRRRG